MTMHPEQMLPIEEFEPQLDEEGKECRYVLNQGVVKAIVVRQYADATADINLIFDGSNLEWFIGFPEGTELGAAVGSLSVVIENVPYGDAPGNWWVPKPIA